MLQFAKRPLTLLLVTAVLYCWLPFAPALAGKVTPSQLQEINQLWQGSAHAYAEVNCSSCHLDSETQALQTHPTQETCRSCHEFEVDTHLLGKHGIRTREGMSPLTPAMSRLPMKAEARDKPQNCNACHNVHSANTQQASVDSCLSCHDDRHSLNFGNSKHGKAWQASAADLSRPSADSVSCATCHLPREVHGDAVLANHNNTYTLLPRDRMVKDVCINCHGLEFSYSSIFDDDLTEANYDRAPTLKLETFDMVRALEKRRTGEE